MYKVITDFIDLQDSNHLYHRGDEYPRAGYSPSEERVDELKSNQNKTRKALIRFSEIPQIEEEQAEEAAQPEEAVSESEVMGEKPKRVKRTKKNDD